VLFLLSIRLKRSVGVTGIALAAGFLTQKNFELPGMRFLAKIAGYRIAGYGV